MIRWRRRTCALGAAAVLIAVVGAAAVRAATVAYPPILVRRLVPREKVLPGSPAGLAWPTGGSAALATGSGQVLATSGSAGAVPLASVTKVMTAYVVLEDDPLRIGQGGPILTITASEAASLPGRIAAGQSVVEVHAGSRLDEYQALQALLLPSADNIADALAVFDAGSLSAFVAEMNARAALLGMIHTRYADASGLDPATVSTPTDQLVLARAVMADPVFASIVDQRAAFIPGVGTVHNYDTLADSGGFTGIKTGSTNSAGGCLLFSVSRIIAGHDLTFYGVVLGQRRGPYIAAALTAASELTDSLYASIRPRPALPAGSPTLLLSRGGRRRILRSSAPLMIVGLPGATVKMTTTAPRLGRYEIGASAAGFSASAPEVAHLGPPTLEWRLAHLLS
jgi:D-alanyl-D-alanine carboxypeptidase (penicillin-binding protein 5/6)